MYYRDEISQEVAGKLLDKLEEISNKRKRKWRKKNKSYLSGLMENYTTKEQR